jgi:hypothetical protein
MTKEVNLKGSDTTPSLQGHNKAPSGHQPQEAEAAEALEEDTEISPENYIAYSAVKTRATPQEHAKVTIQKQKEIAEAEARQNQPKLRHDRISRSRYCILLRAILPTSKNT